MTELEMKDHTIRRLEQRLKDAEAEVERLRDSRRELAAWYAAAHNGNDNPASRAGLRLALMRLVKQELGVSVAAGLLDDVTKDEHAKAEVERLRAALSGFMAATSWVHDEVHPATEEIDSYRAVRLAREATRAALEGKP